MTEEMRFRYGRRRGWFVSHLRDHFELYCSAAFTLSVGLSIAYYIGFFTTLFFYLPFVLFCIPTLAVLDAFDLKNGNRLRWSRIHQLRFLLCCSWCLFMVLSPRYPSSGPSSYLNPSASIPPLKNETYFIASNLYNSAAVLPSWTREMKALIKHLGPDNVFVSIYESNSQDDTKRLLRSFDDDLLQMGVKRSIKTEDTPGRTQGWSLGGHQRVQYMAEVRNKAIQPLASGHTNGRPFNKILFFNDVYFDWSEHLFPVVLWSYYSTRIAQAIPCRAKVEGRFSLFEMYIDLIYTCRKYDAQQLSWDWPPFLLDVSVFI